MCGIITIIGERSNEVVTNALSKIRHRGLDASNVMAEGNFTFGFNRLAIKDKTNKGLQPFVFGNLIGLFNGEIYNHQELREEFDLTTISKSDIEIILPLFERIGSSLIHHLDGFYSGIIFNKGTKQVFVLRDYIGKKPLFYGMGKGYEFIVSELKAIENPEKFEIIPKGFSEIRGGEIEVIEQHQISKESKYNLKQDIFSAVEKRIPQEESQFGVFLSGGLDSSILASVVSNLSNKAIYYVLGNENSLDSYFVSKLSKKLGIMDKVKFVELPKAHELPELISKVVYHTESYNPSIVSNGLATYLLSFAVYQDGLKVVLSGDGADELFCGYPVSKDIYEWFDKRTELIGNMNFTELRRLDLASMAHTIEVRCPFLDRKVYAASEACTIDDLIRETDEGIQGKQILREIFRSDLPADIIDRKKTSFDVGSGIRKLVVEYLTRNGKAETHQLKEIWDNHFQNELPNELYFYLYPTFDKAIERRGIKHK